MHISRMSKHFLNDSRVKLYTVRHDENMIDMIVHAKCSMSGGVLSPCSVTILLPEPFVSLHFSLLLIYFVVDAEIGDQLLDLYCQDFCAVLLCADL